MYSKRHLYLSFVSGSVLGFILGTTFFKRYFSSNLKVYTSAESAHLKRAEEILN
jgi:hypothetical protein